MKLLSIAAFFDGRPGHEKQTRGILHALSEMTATEIECKDVSVTSAAFIRNWTAYLFSFLLSRSKNTNSHPVDLIIGTGTHTHIPMLLYKKLRSNTGRPARVATCMTPDSLLRHEFDLCFIPQHDEPAAADNVFVTQGPPNPVTCGEGQRDDLGLILIGGLDTKSHVWKPEEVLARIRTIVAKNPAIRWTVSSSPRTPENTCQDLEALAASLQHVSFFLSGETPPGWVEEQYARNRSVWVTADSVSMVYEALSAGCAVGILPVQWLQQDNKFQKSLDMLQAKKMIVDFNEWQAGAKMPVPSAEPFNEAARCALEILGRWWPERLQ